MSDHEFVEQDEVRGERWAVCGACGRFRDRHHGDVDLAAESKRLRGALQVLAVRGLVNDSEDVRGWTREWVEQYRDLLNGDRAAP